MTSFRISYLFLILAASPAIAQVESPTAVASLASGSNGGQPPITGGPIAGTANMTANGTQGAPGAGGHGSTSGGASSSPFTYTPSFSMAVAASVAYLIATWVTTRQLFRYKTWYFILFPQAAMTGAAGAIARTHAILNSAGPKPTTAFIVQMMTFGMIPSLLLITTIMTFTRVIWLATPCEKRNKETLRVPPHAISLIWAGTSALPDVVKAVASNLGKPKEGEKPNPASVQNRIQSISLVCQYFIFVCWSLWALRFMVMSRRWDVCPEAIQLRWRKLGWVSVIQGFLLSIRILYGTISFDAMNNPTSFVSQHEWTFWAADQVPIFIVIMLGIAYHPGNYLPREYTRLKFDPKKMEKVKAETPRPRPTSDRTRSDNDKYFEVTTTELNAHPGIRV